MSCSCRAVPWRTFVRGLAQVHRLDVASAVHPVLRPGGGGVSWAAAALRQSRALHATTQLRGQGDGAAAAARESDKRSPIAEVAVGDGSRTQTQTETQTQIQTQIQTKADPNRPSRSPNSEKKKKKREEAAEAAGRPARERTSKSQSQSQTKPQTQTYQRGPKFESKHQPYRPASKQARGFRKPNADFNSDKSGSPTARSSSSSSSTGPGGKSLEAWKVQKAALKAKFPEGWKPRKRLSPDALAGIRALHAQFPEAYTNEALAQKFGVASEAIRRILKTKWTPSAVEEEERQERWFRRGKAVWAQKAALGVKPPKRWRMEGVTRDPGYHEWSRRASRREREWEEEEVRKYREYRESRRGEGSESSRGA